MGRLKLSKWKPAAKRRGFLKMLAFQGTAKFIRRFLETSLILFVLICPAHAAWSPWEATETRSNGVNEIITSVPEIFGLGLIRGYQIYISPLLRLDKCNFTPTCSNYGLQAIKKYGAAKGMMMAFERLSRDHPWAWEEGYDVENGRLVDRP